jgi:hypothetical protein
MRAKFRIVKEPAAAAEAAANRRHFVHGRPPFWLCLKKPSCPISRAVAQKMGGKAMNGLDSANLEAEKLHGDLASDRLRANRRSFPSLIWDGRLGNQGCLSFTTRDELTQIPPTIMKTVVFLAVQRNSGFHVGGTGFLVSEPLPDTTIYSHYIITAAHVIQGIKERAIDGKVHLRANLTRGGVGMVPTNVNDWVIHDDPKIDLAAMPIAAGGEHLDHMYFGLGSIVTDEVISKESIGPGTDLVFPGLFTRHIGTARNIPIARTGTLAALPNDLVLTPRGPMRAYLVEARSIRGLSGSPVFCVVGPIRGNLSRYGLSG